jgi:hypothetical protein
MLSEWKMGVNYTYEKGYNIQYSYGCILNHVVSILYDIKQDERYYEVTYYIEITSMAVIQFRKLIYQQLV